MITIEKESGRLDAFIAENFENISRSSAVKLIKDGLVLVNGKKAKPSQMLMQNDVLTVDLPEAKPLDVIAENIQLDILFEDNDIIVINKPKGMVVHPAAGNYNGTLVNALLYHCKGSLSGINGVLRPGIVHRIDKDTSGVLVVAKNDIAHTSLASQLAEHSMTRVYNAIAVGNIKEDNFTINAPIGRHPVDRKKMAVTTKNSKEAITHITVLQRLVKYTFIEAKLETGRTHQIRVHMAYKGHPILGDEMYAKIKHPFNLQGQSLHAKLLGFKHPTTGEYMEFDTPLPKYFSKILV